MHLRPIFVCLLALFPLSAGLFGQQSAVTSNPVQATTVLSQSAAAINGSVSVIDVTLTGTAERIAGADDETGSFTAQGNNKNSGRFSLNVSSGTYRDARLTAAGQAPSGSWSGPDGMIHEHALHNLFVEAAWFAPGVCLSRLINAQSLSVTLVGQETKNNQAVIHVTVFRTFAEQPANVSPLLQKLSQIDLYLDPTTLFPLFLTYNGHLATDANANVPMEIRYSNYQVVNGVQVPFRVQQFRNGNLFLDLTVQSASFNSGLADSTFVLQQD